MMITIYGLPVTIKYQDLKVLIKQECNIDDFILDYLVSDGEGGKKVRVGLADDSEGSQLIKCLNGYRLSGNILRLVPVGKSALTNSQPQTYPPRNNFPRNDYPGQTEHAVKPMETRPTAWSNNPQWTANPVSAVNTYNYQQPQTINTTYVQPQAAQAKPQFEPRELATSNRVQPHSHTTQSYSYSSKSNLISLGPHRNVPTVPVHEIPESSNRIQASRYPPSYEAPEKPITMMKDNFQGPQYSTQTSSYQSQTLPWTGQQQQKPYEKPSPVFEKKYDERKYPHVQTKTDITKETFKYDKPEYPRYSDDRRQMSPGRRASPDRHMDRQSDRMLVRNVDRQSDRQLDRSSDRQLDRQSDRHIDRPNDRHIDRPTDRHIERPTDRHIQRPTDRHTDRPSDRHIDRPSDRHVDHPTDRHIERPTDRHIERTSDRHIDRQTERHSGMQRVSPSRPIADRIPGRRVSPEMSRMDRHSPATHPDRRYSPNRQMAQSPTRKMSPHRRISPSTRKEEYVRGRRLSPTTHSAMDRHTSRQSPSRMRHESPTRHATRYSPRHDKPREYDEHRAVKDVRPAYESQASKEAMYSGGYRPNVRVDVQYQRKDWQDREKQFSSKNIPEDRRDVARMQKFDIPRASDPQRIIEDEKKRSRSRTSRSPRRSPVRDRFRRHSPSPRSPRRSWALEKRRSPESREPPPPPAWPGQDGRKQDYQQQRSTFTERIEKKPLIWEVSTQEKKSDEFTKNDRRNFEDQRVRTDVPKWKPLPQASPKEAPRFVDEDRFQKEAKYSRKDFEGRHALSREDDDRKSYPERRDKDYPRSERDEARYKPNMTHKDMIIKKHQEYAGTIEEKKKEILHKQEQLQKEIDEVYKRAVDFTKKAEMYKKSELKKDFQYKDDHRRDDKEYEERLKYAYEDDRRGRQDYRKEFNKPFSKADEPKFGNFGNSRDSEDFERKFGANAAIKIKRIKAMDEISKKILKQYASDKTSDVKKRISEELKLSIGKILVDMFGDKDVSFIEMLVKFNARHTQRDEERIFEDVMSCLPSHYRTLKRPSKGDSETSAKVSRRSAEPNLIKDQQPIVNKQLNWNYGNLGILPGNIVVSPTLPQIQPSGLLLNSPIMVPVPAPYQVIPAYQEVTKNVDENKKDGYNLYLCKDDFQPILEHEADQVKSFLVKQLIKVTETSQGWAPDFTLSTQHSSYRHEVLTRDERSKDWLLSLDFSDFKEFTVLVYTTEELWYERAAIWLPGHSRCRKVDPLTKLKLQNRNLEGVNIGKWKLVKKIVTEKGTRIYVDMPPSSARALEKHTMMLSYELQKVNVFFKAVAIDKDAFDAGLNESSIKVLPNPASCSMPSLGQDPKIIKIARKGNKPLNLVTARKIKDIILFKLFKYHQLEGKSRTDFIKYGFCQPGFFGILPENEESRKWLISLDIPRINRQPVVIIGADEDKGKYFKMTIVMPKDYCLKSALAFERLRQSNQGVKGINFSMWQNLKLNVLRNQGRVFLEVDMDLESVETLSQMDYKLDYVVEGHEFKTVDVESQYSRDRLEEMIKNYKDELNDSYDVYNMDLESDSEEKRKREAIKVQSNEVQKRPVEASPKFEDEKKIKVVKITKQGKTETKPVIKEEKVTEQDIQREKQEIKTPKEEELKQEDPGLEENQIQLSQQMTHVLEEELQDIMIQMWKTLPDVAASDTERFVTERLKDDVSDEIKKILGLNVTKRLLDVSNPLFVKIQFYGRPESGFLTKFLETHKIVSFKRIDQDSNTFAAKLNSISDFDNICTAKDLRCGSAKLTVSPFYKFTKCPDNLKTMYANKIQYEFGTDNEKASKMNNENNVKAKDNSSENVKAEVTDKKEVKEKTKPEEKLTPVTKTQIKQKAQENPKPVKNDSKTDKSLENKCRIKEMLYKKEIFAEINEMDPEFNEEINDDEILALISGGVVVDQCSGSDQE